MDECDLSLETVTELRPIADATRNVRGELCTKAGDTVSALVVEIIEFCDIADALEVEENCTALVFVIGVTGTGTDVFCPKADGSLLKPTVTVAGAKVTVANVL
jgi:hypothetical protein